MADKKVGYHLDGAGLYLQISKYLSSNWIFRYALNGRTRDMGLGSYPTVPLSVARKLALEQREHIIRGDDPLELRQAKKDQARSDALEAVLFKDAAKAYLDLYTPTWKNAKHKQQWRNTLDQYAMHSLGSRRALAITQADITETLAPIWNEKQETASRVKQRVERIIEWVKAGRPMPKGKRTEIVKHHKAMPIDELPAFIAKLRERDSISARALEFTILTATRTNEAIGAAWSEIDLKAKTWTIPAARMKAKREHLVPLSDRVVNILASLPRTNGFVFPGASNDTLSNMAMLELLRGLAGNGYTVHGFRSTFRDWAGDHTNFPRDVIEHALAHAVKDQTEAAYRRSDAPEKRRKLMDAWASFLGPEHVGNVTKLRRE
jgi:integrase